MIAPGPLEEVGRHGQDLGPGDGQRAIQLGKAQVVADRQADLRPVHVPDHGPVARCDPIRFPVGWAILELDVEQVDLAIGGRDRAARVDQDARVVRPAGRPRLGQRAGQDPHAVLSGDGREGIAERSGDRPGRCAIARVRAAELEVLGQGDEPGAVRRLGERAASDIGLGIGSCIELDDGHG